MMTVHQILIDSFNSLREPEYQAEGLCKGISLRWLEAFLVGEEEQFLKRIDKIISYNGQLKEKINALQTKRGQNLNEEDGTLIDILAFFDSVSLFSFSHQYPTLFNATLHQSNSEQISVYASSDKSRANGGLKKLYSQPLVYTESELKNYLDDLAMTLDKVDSNSAPVGINLSSYGHSISLIYKPRFGWRIMDINNYPPNWIPAHENHILASIIRSNLKGKTLSDYTGFTASVVTLGNDERLATLKSELLSLKKRHAVVTEEIAQRKIIESEGCWFLNLANMHSYEEIVKIVEDKEALILINNVPYYVNHDKKLIEEIQLTDENMPEFEQVKKIWKDPVEFVFHDELFELICSVIGHRPPSTAINLGLLAAEGGYADVRDLSIMGYNFNCSHKKFLYQKTMRK